MSRKFLSSDMLRMILTSKRISKDLRLEHVRRCRELLELLGERKEF